MGEEKRKTLNISYQLEGEANYMMLKIFQNAVRI